MGKLQTKFTAFMDSKGLDLIEEYIGKFNKYLNGFIDDLGKLKFNELVAVSYTHLTLPTNREV